MIKFILLLAICFTLRVSGQIMPELIKDINPGEGNSYPGRFCAINDVVYFFANDGINGIELWRTDATEAGTFMVKNIGPGVQSHCESTFGCGSEFIVMNDILYFRATDNVHGAEIWRSDGTEAGTYMVKDINPGLGDCSNSIFMSAQYFTDMDNILYFAADGGGNNIELWRSDGTEAGTYLVKDFAVGLSSIPQYLSNINGVLYFFCQNENNEPEVWKSDGTAAGSVLLKQMWTRSYDYSNAFFEFDGYIYFSGDDDDIYDLELWRTDGTPAGTELFINLNTSAGDGSDPREFKVMNDKLLFSARPETDDVLYASDGTEAGTIILNDNNGDAFSVGFYGLLAENKLFFQGYGTGSTQGLWITDGTNAGTKFLSPIESGSFEDYSSVVVNANNILYRGYDDDNGCTSVFQSNGTTDGTYQSIDCDILTDPYEMISYNDKVLLAASNDLNGGELWLFEPEFTEVVSVEEINKVLNIYPNPANEYIIIENAQGILNSKVVIFNVEGKLVKSFLYSNKINVSDLLPGMYILSIDNSFQKFVKQ